MSKPKGGRGITAPYDTKLMRVPIGLEPQIQQLVERYRDWIDRSGSHTFGANKPPLLLDKAVNSFSERNGEVVALLKKAVTPKSQGGSYAANNATTLRQLVQQALVLLQEG